MMTGDESNIMNGHEEGGSARGETIQVATRTVRLGFLLFLGFLVGAYRLGSSATRLEGYETDLGDVETIIKRHSNKLKPNGFALTKEKIGPVRKVATELIDMLDDYYSVYDGGAQQMLFGSNGWARDWEIESSSTNSNTNNDTTTTNNTNIITMGEKMVDTMVRALMDPTQESFIVGIIGSSVAAGHDNCRYDNYASQLSRTFSKVWNAAGMTLDVQNAGETGGCGDSYANQVWCVTQNVSPFADIVHYSWSYFENSSADEPKIARESLVRWTQLLKKQPPVHLVYVNENKFSPNNYKEESLFNAYSQYAYNAFSMRKSFTSGMHKGKHKDNEKIYEGNHVGDGYHNTTRYGENETNLERRDSLGVILRNWHPGPLGFQLISDAFAYVYTKHLLLALDEIEKGGRNTGSKIKKVSKQQWWTEKRPIIMQSDMDPPLFCDPNYCAVEAPPTCTSYEFPVFGWYGASVAAPDDALNPFKGEEETDPHNEQKQKWTRFIQKVDRTEYFIPKLEQKLYKSDPSFCAFNDTCGNIGAKTAEQGRLVFKLPKLEVGLVLICGVGREGAKSMFIDNASLEINFNGKILDRETFDLYPNEKCARIIKEPDGLNVGSNGHSYLSLRLLEPPPGNATFPVAPVGISQIMTL